MRSFLKLSPATFIAVLCTAGFACLPGTSRADYTVTLNNANDKISPYTGPYGTVNVHLNVDGSAAITLTSNTVGQYTYLFGDGATLALNVNATSFTASDIVGTQPA